jgi:hypothetical protein
MTDPKMYFREYFMEKRKESRKSQTEPIYSTAARVGYFVKRLPSGCILYQLQPRIKQEQCIALKTS